MSIYNLKISCFSRLLKIFIPEWFGAKSLHFTGPSCCQFGHTQNSIFEDVDSHEGTGGLGPQNPENRFLFPITDSRPAFWVSQCESHGDFVHTHLGCANQQLASGNNQPKHAWSPWEANSLKWATLSFGCFTIHTVRLCSVLNQAGTKHKQKQGSVLTHLVPGVVLPTRRDVTLCPLWNL